MSDTPCERGVVHSPRYAVFRRRENWGWLLQTEVGFGELTYNCQPEKQL